MGDAGALPGASCSEGGGESGPRGLQLLYGPLWAGGEDGDDLGESQLVGAPCGAQRQRGGERAWGPHGVPQKGDSGGRDTTKEESREGWDARRWCRGREGHSEHRGGTGLLGPPGGIPATETAQSGATAEGTRGSATRHPLPDLVPRGHRALRGPGRIDYSRRKVPEPGSGGQRGHFTCWLAAPESLPVLPRPASLSPQSRRQPPGPGHLHLQCQLSCHLPRR